MKKDYYDVLGVNKSASKDDIKKAFHKLAHQYHPDKKGGDEAKFKQINEAYQILSDDAKRSKYDQFGSGFENMSSGGYGDAGGFDFSNFSGFQGGNFDFDSINDIFSEFFAGAANMNGNHGGKQKKGRDISTEIQISFTDSIFGGERKILIDKVSNCANCSGAGAKKGSKMITCKSCNGKGKIHETRKSFLGAISTTRVCNVCSGYGNVPEELCEKCSGSGVIRRENEITINIPAGIRDGEMIRLSGMGEAISRGTPGDLYIKINVEKHNIFKREGNDLVMTLNIKLSEFLLGAEYPIQTFDGEIKITIPKGIGVNEILRVRGKGVPISKYKRGDILIKLNIKFPTSLSKKAKDLILELQKEGV